MTNQIATSAKPAKARALDARRRFYEIPAGAAIAGGMLTLLAFALAYTVLKNIGPTPAEVEAVRRSLLPDCREYLKPEAMERWLFILLTLASPFCVLAGMRIARLVPGLFPALAEVVSGRGIVAAMAALAGGVCIYLLHGTSLFVFFVYPESALADQAVLCLAALFLFLVAWQKGFWRPGAKKQGGLAPWRFAVVALALAITLPPHGLSVHSIGRTTDITPFAWTNHFQAVVYSLTQIYAGKPLLTSSPPLYGYYAEFLLPLFKLTGLSVFKFSVVMGLLQAGALSAVLIVVVRHVRMPAVRLLCCAALLYFVGNNCLVGRRPYDPLFQYWPVRFIFPALSVPIFLEAARRSKPLAWAALGAFSGLALMWNLETGIAVAGATLFTSAVEALGAWRNARPARKSVLWLAPVITGLVMLLVAALFWLFLQIQAAWKAPLHETLDYQRLFYQAGLMMEPMPLAPHPWWIVIAVYLAGLAFGLRALLDGRRGDTARLVLFLTILGTGLFTYYQGRSVDFNLMNAAWPAIILAFLFTDRLLRAIRARLLPRGICWVALPAAYLGVMALVMLPSVMVHAWSFGMDQWARALSAKGTGKAMDQRVAFVRASVGRDRDCVILANYQAVYFMETGLRSSLDGPGLSEIFFMRDLDHLHAALKSNPPRHLFVDADNEDRLQLTDTLKSAYRTVSTSPDGKLLYMEPVGENAVP